MNKNGFPEAHALLDFVRIKNEQPVYQFKNPAGTP